MLEKRIVKGELFVLITGKRFLPLTSELEASVALSVEQAINSLPGISLDGGSVKVGVRLHVKGMEQYGKRSGREISTP